MSVIPALKQLRQEDCETKTTTKTNKNQEGAPFTLLSLVRSLWGHGTYDFLFPTFADLLDLLTIVTLVPTVLTRNGPHSLGQCIYFMV
jgi:hypothetical protein